MSGTNARFVDRSGHVTPKLDLWPSIVISKAGLKQGENEGENRTESAQPLPTEYTLHQNYPNPFNPTTRIQYDLPEASNVRLSIYNILGQEVKTLVDGYMNAGYQTVEWNSTNNSGTVLPSGVYIYRMQAQSVKSGEFHQVKKMILIK